MLDQLMIMGYWVSGAGFLLCAIGYFAFPVMIRLLDGDDN